MRRGVVSVRTTMPCRAVMIDVGINRLEGKLIQTHFIL